MNARQRRRAKRDLPPIGQPISLNGRPAEITEYRQGRFGDQLAIVRTQDSTGYEFRHVYSIQALSQLLQREKPCRT